MPWPISAGVLGMLRTTRSLPLARAIEAEGMPAITDSCSAPPTQARSGAAASAKSWGLTAQTTVPARPKLASPAASACRPNSARSLSRCGACGSTTCSCAGARPARSRPPMMALAMLPPPMKAITWELMREV